MKLFVLFSSCLIEFSVSLSSSVFSRALNSIRKHPSDSMSSEHKRLLKTFDPCVKNGVCQLFSTTGESSFIVANNQPSQGSLFILQGYIPRTLNLVLLVPTSSPESFVHSPGYLGVVKKKEELLGVAMSQPAGELVTYQQCPSPWTDPSDSELGNLGGFHKAVLQAALLDYWARGLVFKRQEHGLLDAAIFADGNTGKISIVGVPTEKLQDTETESQDRRSVQLCLSQGVDEDREFVHDFKMKRIGDDFKALNAMLKDFCLQHDWASSSQLAAEKVHDVFKAKNTAEVQQAIERNVDGNKRGYCGWIVKSQAGFADSFGIPNAEPRATCQAVCQKEQQK